MAYAGASFYKLIDFPELCAPDPLGCRDNHIPDKK